MALRAGYKGFKKLLPGLKITRPGTLGIDNDVLIPELNKKFFPRSEQAVLGAKNFVIADNVSKTANGVTFTVNSDGTVDVSTESGGATANTEFIFHAFLKANTNYKMTGCPVNGGWNKYLIYINGTEILHTGDMADTGNGAIFLINEDKKIPVRIYIISGTVITTPIKFSPMIRLASDPDDTYVPYAMTNRELTDEKWDKTMVLASGDLDDYKTAGMYYWSTTAPSHSPENLTFCKMIVFVGAGSIHQVVLRGNGYVAMRQYDGSEWKSWYKFTSTEITP